MFAPCLTDDYAFGNVVLSVGWRLCAAIEIGDARCWRCVWSMRALGLSCWVWVGGCVPPYINVE